ncbi:AEC family transporter [Caenispirillum salinarum]|uniref:AEC family transporter n=1 Tax=Caenispirillum salinarum TaxID=859058 RepID=UPI00384E72EF
MTETLGIVLPIFGVMALGWIFARRSLISEAGVSGIVNFVFFLAIPALLFRTLANGAVEGRFDARLIAGFFSAALLHFALGWLVSRFVFRNSAEACGLAAMSGGFGNLVLVGLPLVQRAYGDAGLVPLMLIIMVHSAILFTATTLAIEAGRSGGGSWVRRLGGTLKSVFLNPIVIAALSGLVFGMLGLRLPGVVDETLALVGRGAAPVALFAVGATLATCRIAGDLREALVMTALKLLVLPVLVWVFAALVFELRTEWVTVAVLAGAMPAGANVYVFARKFDIYVNRATAVVLLSTVLSVVTLTALIATLPPP